jgi:hypothetical protein
MQSSFVPTKLTQLLAFRFRAPRECDAYQMIEDLMPEVFQTETSAKKHCTREALRLEDAPPAIHLRAIATHAASALEDLGRVARELDLPDSAGGRIMGRLFSIARVSFFDQIIPVQLSYRGTLLGLRHGVDLVTLLRGVLTEEPILPLIDWCDTWLEDRVPMVELATRELAWFAAHPQAAQARPAGFHA